MGTILVSSARDVCLCEREKLSKPETELKEQAKSMNWQFFIADTDSKCVIPQWLPFRVPESGRWDFLLAWLRRPRGFPQIRRMSRQDLDSLRGTGAGVQYVAELGGGTEDPIFIKIDG
jgi:hypothetical protein